MGLMDDNNLDNIDLDIYKSELEIKVDTVIDAQKMIIDMLSNLDKKLDNIDIYLHSKDKLSKDGTLKQTRGRKRFVMFYEDKVVTDEQLHYLKYTMGVPVSKIAENLKYINDYGEVIICTKHNKNTIKTYINNRIGAYEKQLKEDKIC